MMIIGILATVAMPQYRKYQYEALATQTLNDIYAIDLPPVTVPLSKLGFGFN